MRYRVERAATVERDLELIFDHLVEAYAAFGETAKEARSRAGHRIDGIQDSMMAFEQTPHQGTLRPELGSTTRSVTRSRAVFYFDVDDNLRRVRILAVFFGGQDHVRHMLKRG